MRSFWVEGYFFLLFASLGLVLTLFLFNSFMVWSCLHLVLWSSSLESGLLMTFGCPALFWEEYRRSCIEGDSTKLILFLVVRVYVPSAHLGFIKSWLLEVSQWPLFSTSFLESRSSVQGEPDSAPSFLKWSSFKSITTQEPGTWPPASTFAPWAQQGSVEAQSVLWAFHSFLIHGNGYLAFQAQLWFTYLIFYIALLCLRRRRVVFWTRGPNMSEDCLMALASLRSRCQLKFWVCWKVSWPLH